MCGIGFAFVVRFSGSGEALVLCSVISRGVLQGQLTLNVRDRQLRDIAN